MAPKLNPEQVTVYQTSLYCYSYNDFYLANDFPSVSDIHKEQSIVWYQGDKCIKK